DKWFMYEESIRVPLIIVDPRMPLSARQRDVESIALNVDVAPTILDLAELAAPATMQGRTLLPFLRGAAPTKQRTEFFYEHHYLPARIPPSEGVRTERWKYIRWLSPNPLTEELYDLAVDPLEENDLAADPAHAGELMELRAKWGHYAEELK
ncbi:MAG TPA: sulfatase/phosphatase domain-containing protein, partial [Chthoniobacteraceae bacterium]|nr:sulfatase/phosphatase domain-containing protein [Chthoniobacteraceae bacterium]